MVSMCVVLLLSLGMRAQGGPPPGGGGPPTPARELARLTKTLTLTEAQQAAILPILEKRHTEMEALRSSGAESSASREQMHAIMDSTNTAIKAQLTEAQVKSYDAMRPPRPPSQGGTTGSEGETGNGPPPAPPEGSASPQR